MFRFSLIVCIFTFAISAQAQKRTPAQRKSSATQSGPSSATTRAPKPVRNFWQVRFGYTYGQENIHLKSGTAGADMETQSEGLLGSVNYVLGSRSRWRQQYGLEVGNGRLKGKGNTIAIPDELRGQVWFLFGVAPGLTYRSSEFSEVGLSVPIHYRMINWQLQAGTTLDPERDASFSVGGRGHYIARFSPRSALELSATYHHLWQAVFWGASWQIDFQ